MATSETLSPFYHWTEKDHNQENLNTRHRLRCYQKFIGRERFGEYERVRDIGRPNYVGRGLGIRWNTGHDLDKGLIRNSAESDVICCFEVLNHIMNPLLLLEDCYRSLSPNGRLYLSVPKLWLVPWHHCHYDFVIYDPERLERLFRYVGFEVVRRETHNPWPWYFMFYGVRPFFRVLFHRISVWELRKP